MYSTTVGSGPVAPAGASSHALIGWPPNPENVTSSTVTARSGVATRSKTGSVAAARAPAERVGPERVEVRRLRPLRAVRPQLGEGQVVGAHRRRPRDGWTGRGAPLTRRWRRSGNDAARRARWTGPTSATSAVSGRSVDDRPTWIRTVPGSTTRRYVGVDVRQLLGRELGTTTVRHSPASRWTRRNPRSSRTGRATDASSSRT